MNPKRKFSVGYQTLVAVLALYLELGALSTNAFADTSGTAAQYFFSKAAVGNTWTMQSTCSGTRPCSGSTSVYVVTANVAGAITETLDNGVTATDTHQIDATGAWINSGTDSVGSHAFTVLPATFSVGTNWTKPYATGSVATDTIAAFNVTRTVPAGTFTDCLQINETYTSGATTVNTTFYLSPTAGSLVESIIVYTDPLGTMTLTDKLQSFTYTPSIAVATTTVSRSDCLFNWAEKTYAQYFSPAGATDVTAPPYTYRYYSGTRNYLAVSSADNSVYVLGPSFGPNPLAVGPVANFLGVSGCQ